MKDDFVDKILMFILGLLCTAMLLVVVSLPFALHASYICGQNGYPRSYFVFPNEISCGRIVNQTEYICSLDKVLSKTCFPPTFDN